MYEYFDMDLINEQIKQWCSGNRQIEDELITKLYPYIHQIARKQFKSKDVTALQTTEIINEAFINLRIQKSTDILNKQHFLALISKIIRNVSIDHYRSESRIKRGGTKRNLTLDRMADFLESPCEINDDILSLDELLTELESVDVFAAQVVECKIFGGLTIPEMSKVLAVSESTVSRNWKFARLWLLAKMK
jgi:RNA polymerase sigma factor (TIGR02999 family)